MIESLLEESRARFGQAATVEVSEGKSSYEVSVRRDGKRAEGRIRRIFWQDYLDSGRTDNCDCVDHFFEHLERQLGAG